MKQHGNCNCCAAPLNPLKRKCDWCGQFHEKMKYYPTANIPTSKSMIAVGAVAIITTTFLIRKR